MSFPLMFLLGDSYRLMVPEVMVPVQMMLKSLTF